MLIDWRRFGIAKASDIINKAKSYIGTKESPSGSNNVIFNTHYYGKTVSGAYPWCCVFVWDIFRMCNASHLFYNGKKTAYCPDLQVWAKEKSLSVDVKDGKAGDIVLFDWNGNKLSDHVGIIENKNLDGSYITIEGNTSLTSDDNGGKVMRRTRKLKEILLIIRPDYEEEIEMFAYKNKTGKALPVYAESDLKTQIGTLNAGATCTSFGIHNKRAILYYKVLATGVYKVGFTDKTEGLL